MPETSFRFPCYGRLKQTLGKIDAIAECTELAVSDFAARASKAENAIAFIKELSVEHKIKVDHVRLASPLVRLAQLHVESVHQIAEQVFEEFRDEYLVCSPKSGPADMVVLARASPRRDSWASEGRTSRSSACCGRRIATWPRG
jgi:hypothetical protein